MTTAGKLLGGSFVLFILNAVALSQIPEGWEIREIAPAGTEYYYGPPDINDRGQIVFDRRLWPSLPEIEIMLYSRGKLVQLTDDHIRDVFPRLNNRGVVVWSRDLAEDGLLSIVRWTNGQIDIISEPGHADLDGGADINDLGLIVWDRSPLRPPDHTQIFLFNGIGVVQLTNDESANYVPRINQRGDVVFTQYDFSDSSYTANIVGYLGGTWRQLTTGSLNRYAPDLNDLTEIVWSGTHTGVELWRDGTTVQLLETGGAFNINNRSEIAVSRRDHETGNHVLGILRRNGEIQEITSEFEGGASINNRGEVAFVTGEFPYTGVSVFTRGAFAADFDFDAQIDLQDASVFQACFGRTVSTSGDSCWATDTDADGDVDLVDFQILIAFLEGPE